MFVLELIYTAPIEEIDALLPNHRAWLDAHYASGDFLASGPKNPRDGGVIIVAGDDRTRVEELVAGDPFGAAGLCTYRITEFVAVKTAPALEEHRQQPPA